MNIHITVVCYALDITPLVQCLSGPDVTWHLFTHSSRPEMLNGVSGVYYNSYDYAPSRMHLYDYRFNRGLARSWNDGLYYSYGQGADVAFLINDDITASRYDLYMMADAAMAHREAGAIEAIGYDVRMGRRQAVNYQFGAFNPIALEKVGYLDENFWPAYFEDCDQAQRFRLAGVPFYNAGESTIVHQSATTTRVSPELAVAHEANFNRNKAYYVAKWGGEPGSEIFTTPFNDPTLGVKISAEMRHNPYPAFWKKIISL